MIISPSLSRSHWVQQKCSVNSPVNATTVAGFYSLFIAGHLMAVVALQLGFSRSAARLRLTFKWPSRQAHTNVSTYYVHSRLRVCICVCVWEFLGVFAQICRVLYICVCHIFVYGTACQKFYVYQITINYNKNPITYSYQKHERMHAAFFSW